jgi:hypothetical protein
VFELHGFLSFLCGFYMRRYGQYRLAELSAVAFSDGLPECAPSLFPGGIIGSRAEMARDKTTDKRRAS